MLNRIILLVFVLLVIISAAYALRDNRDFTTSSDEAYQLFLESKDLANKLYTRESSDKLMQAIKLDSNFAMALLALAERNFAYGRMEKGNEFMERALAQYNRLKKHEKMILDLEKLYFAGKTEQALEKTREYVRAFPKRIEGHEMLAAKAWEQGEIQIAIDEYESLLKIDPEYAPAYNALGYLEFGNGNFNKALKHFDKYLQLLPDQANPHDSRGEILMAVGRYDEALEEFKTAYQIEPKFAFVLNHMADAYIGKGMFSKADQIFDKVGNLLTEESERKTLLINRAHSYWNRLEAEPAIRIADTLMMMGQTQNSASLRLWANLIHSMAYMQEDLEKGLQYFNLAENEYKLILEKSGTEVWIESKGWLELTRSFLNLKREKYDSVLVLEQFTQDKRFWRPDQLIDIKNVLAQAYYGLGQKDKAFALLNENLNLNPNRAYTLITMARMLEKDGQKDLAVQYLNNLLNGPFKEADQDTPKYLALKKWLAELTAQAA